MEKARQYSPVIPRHLAAAISIALIGEVASALAIIVLAFLGSAYIFVALNFFGAFIAFRTALILGYGITQRIVIHRMRPVFQREQPAKFWLLIGLNAVGVFVGLFMTQLPIE